MQDDGDGRGGPGGQRKRKESGQANSLLTTSGKLLRSGSTGVLLRVMICGHGSASPTHRPRSNRERMDGLTDTPGSVLPFRYRHGSSGHPSTNAVAGALQRPTRTLGRAALKRVLSGLAPGGVYLAFPVTREAGGLLHHRFTLTWFVPLSNRRDPGGLFSVALACGLPRVGVTHHPALRSPDVPRATCVTRGRLVNPSTPQSTGELALSCRR